MNLTWGLVCCGQDNQGSPPIITWSRYCIPCHLIRSCWYHRRCHQPFQALNRWFPLFLRSCQWPLCGSWENDLTHRQLLSAAWVILYSHFYWEGGGGLSRTYHCKQGVRPWWLGPSITAKKICFGSSPPVVKRLFLMPCEMRRWGPWPWRFPPDLDVSELVEFVCPFFCCWQMVWISTKKRPGEEHRTKSEKSSSTVTKRPHGEVGGSGLCPNG